MSSGTSTSAASDGASLGMWKILQPGRGLLSQMRVWTMLRASSPSMSGKEERGPTGVHLVSGRDGGQRKFMVAGVIW